MANEKQITMNRVINAAPEEVWKAWTDPKVFQKWWGPNGVTTPICEIDPRVGGKIFAEMLAGKELGEMAGQRWPMKGVFKEISPVELLVFQNNAVTTNGDVLIEGETTVSMKESEGKTNLTVTASAKGKTPEAPQMIEGMEQGWNESLDKLVKLFE